MTFPFLVSGILESPQQKRLQHFPGVLRGFRERPWAPSSPPRQCGARAVRGRSAPAGADRQEPGHGQGRPPPADRACRDRGRRVSFCGGPSVTWEGALESFLHQSGFAIGCKSLSFLLQVSDFSLQNGAGEREKVSF